MTAKLVEEAPPPLFPLPPLPAVPPRDAQMSMGLAADNGGWKAPVSPKSALESYAKTITTVAEFVWFELEAVKAELLIASQDHFLDEHGQMVPNDLGKGDSERAADAREKAAIAQVRAQWKGVKDENVRALLLADAIYREADGLSNATTKVDPDAKWHLYEVQRLQEKAGELCIAVTGPGKELQAVAALHREADRLDKEYALTKAEKAELVRLDDAGGGDQKKAALYDKLAKASAAHIKAEQLRAMAADITSLKQYRDDAKQGLTDAKQDMEVAAVRRATILSQAASKAPTLKILTEWVKTLNEQWREPEPLPGDEVPSNAESGEWPQQV